MRGQGSASLKHVYSAFNSTTLWYAREEDMIACYWILAEFFFFRIFMNRDEVEVYENGKKKRLIRGLYPTTMTEQA